MEYEGLKIDHFEHDSFRIKSGSLVVYFDPYNLKENQVEPANYIFITHEHFDHCSEKDIKKIAKSNTIIIASASCSQQHFLSRLGVKSLIFMAPDDFGQHESINVQAVPAYNLDKPFHQKTGNRAGFVLEINKLKIYHAGDTDLIPEMSDLKNINVALLPVSGTYVMTWQEAAEAVKIIKPQLAIPMHYGAIIGSEEDARKFKEKAGCQVEII